MIFNYKVFTSFYFMRDATDAPKTTTGPKAYIADTLHDRIERKGAATCLNCRKYVRLTTRLVPTTRPITTNGPIPLMGRKIGRHPTNRPFFLTSRQSIQNLRRCNTL